MPDETFVSIKELAKRLGMDKSHARRYVLKLGFKPQKRRTPDSANQLTLTVTAPEAEAIVQQRLDQGFLPSDKAVPYDVRFFYVIQLVPELAPLRVKLGFANDMSDRLAQHRTSAPTATIVKTWPCRRTWEVTAMDALTAGGARLILNEVFEVDDLQDLVQRGDSFFASLPAPAAKLPLAPHSPYESAEHNISAG